MKIRNDYDLRRRFLLSAFLLCVMSTLTLAQALVLPGNVDWTKPAEEVVAALLQWYNFAVLLSGYLITHFSQSIPGLKKIDNLAVRAAIATGVVAVIFYFAGANSWGLVAAFLTMLNPYEIVGKKVFGPTPRKVEPGEAYSGGALTKANEDPLTEADGEPEDWRNALPDFPDTNTEQQ